MATRKRTAILISGRGSNMVSLIRAAREPTYPAEIALVVSNRADALGLERAREAGVPSVAIESRSFATDRAAHEAAIDDVLRRYCIELVCLAGYLRILTPFFIDRWSGRIINIHPSLLPAFPGLETHKRALEANAKLHGCTVHLVTTKLDEGPILAQAAVPVLTEDTEESLAARVLAQEHNIYPLALAMLAGGKTREANGEEVLLNPSTLA